MPPHKLPLDIQTAHPYLLSTLHERTVGALVGSALGDAIGLYTEFLSAAYAKTNYPTRKFTLHPTATPFYRDMHRLKHKSGDWTDDTDHSLLVLLSFLHNGTLDPKDFAARLKVWVDQGLRALDTLPLGLGNLVGTVVRSQGYVDDPERIAKSTWEKRGGNIAPNGSLMRTHPVGLACLLRTEEETFEEGARLSKVTHADPRCVFACALGSALVRAVVRGEIESEEELDAVIRRATDWFLLEEGELDVDELKKHVNAESLADLKLDDRTSIGYVYKALGSGVVVLRTAIRRLRENNEALLTQLGLFEEIITDLIMCGGDADTNACFAGAVLGGFLGYKALPGHWKHGLRHEWWLMQKSEGLCQMLKITKGDYDGKQDLDTRPDGGRGFLDMKVMEERFNKLHYAILADMAPTSKAKSTGIFNFGWPRGK